MFFAFLMIGPCYKMDQKQKVLPKYTIFPSFFNLNLCFDLFWNNVISFKGILHLVDEYLNELQI